MATRARRPAALTFTQDSVERALDLHMPGKWRRDGPGRYYIDTLLGTVVLRTLREAYAFVLGCAEADRRRRGATAP